MYDCADNSACDRPADALVESSRSTDWVLGARVIEAQAIVAYDVTLCA